MSNEKHQQNIYMEWKKGIEDWVLELEFLVDNLEWDLSYAMNKRPSEERDWNQPTDVPTDAHGSPGPPSPPIPDW